MHKTIVTGRYVGSASTSEDMLNVLTKKWLLDSAVGRYLFLVRAIMTLSSNRGNKQKNFDFGWSSFLLQRSLGTFAPPRLSRMTIKIGSIFLFECKATLTLVSPRVTSKKYPNIYKSCPKMISTQMKDFNNFKKLTKTVTWFGQNNCCHRLWKVAQSAIYAQSGPTAGDPHLSLYQNTIFNL